MLTVYNSCDKNSDEMLSFNEFSKLLLKIDNKLTDDELKLCFYKFDHNEDHTISF
jgi:Ca2+-binding EF-hand superfamily protein